MKKADIGLIGLAVMVLAELIYRLLRKICGVEHV